jgi:hypothetical protein
MNTTYWLNKVNDFIFNISRTTALPSTYTLGLSTTTPTVSGTNVTEPSGNGYSRIAITGLSASVNGLVTNSSNLYFPISTGSWGTITHYVIYGDTTGTNLLAFGALTTSQAVSIDNIVTIVAGELDFQLSNPA